MSLKMSLKVFLRLFIALSVLMTGRSQTRTECVNFKKDNEFSFTFLPNDLKHNMTVWENAVRKITNYTNSCLKGYLFNRNKALCRKPVIIITFPLISGNPTIPLQVLPKPYLATKEASFSTESQVLSALGQIWKLFVFCLLAAAISGIVIWFLASINRHFSIVNYFTRHETFFLSAREGFGGVKYFEHKINSDELPKSFCSGTREGWWWAVVTMTTVGYGDKTPKSFLGRVYASLWMIIGLLLMSTFTAQISSTITTYGLRPLDEEFGYNIGVPYGSREFFETYSEGGKLKEYSTEDDLFQSLQDGMVDKIWLINCQRNGVKRAFKIVKVLRVPSVIGAKAELVRPRYNLKSKFDKCLINWTKSNMADNDGEEEEKKKEKRKKNTKKIKGKDRKKEEEQEEKEQEDEDEDEEDDEELTLLQKVASLILEEKEQKDKIPEQQRECIESHSHSKYQEAKWSATQMGLIDNLLYITAGILIALSTAGALWDSFTRVRQSRKAKDVNVDIEKAAAIQELQLAVISRN